MQLLDYITLAVCVIAAVLLLSPAPRRSELWRATITPLASIIGSGFLVVAPLLHSFIGRWALLGMCGLLVFAYGIGACIRFNITHAEPHFAVYHGDWAARLETSSQLFLGIAFAISVAFYTSLLIAFIFDTAGLQSEYLMRLATSGLLTVIMLVAWWRGEKGLELMELLSVTIKLAIIIALLIALASYDVMAGFHWFQHESLMGLDTWSTLTMLGGMLMVTQGFETTRYMGREYGRGVRVRAMKYSQWISTAIYLLFIGLTSPIFLEFPLTELNETSIIHLMGNVLVVLPVILLIAAVASQFSAALADTIGGGGLFRELIPLGVSDNIYYMLITGLAILLVWTSHIFEIINYASKGFALYYLLQVVICLLLVSSKPRLDYRLLRTGGCILLCGLLLFVIIASTPAPHH